MMKKRKASGLEGRRSGDNRRACNKDGGEAGTAADVPDSPVAGFDDPTSSRIDPDRCCSNQPGVSGRVEAVQSFCERDKACPNPSWPDLGRLTKHSPPAPGAHVELQALAFANPLRGLPDCARVPELTEKAERARVASVEVHPKRMLETPGSPMKMSSARKRHNG